MKIPIVSAAILGSLSGCFSSAYQPSGSAPMALLVRDNRMYVAHEGTEVAVGWTGGGLIRSVSSVEPARDAAWTFRRRRIASLVLGAFSLGCAGVTGYLFEASRDQETGTHDASTGLKVAAWGCVVGLGTALIVHSSAEPYLFDAVNLFNAAKQESRR